MPPSTLICRTFLSPGSIRLGRFVLNLDEPQADFFDPDYKVTPDSINVQPHLSYEEVQHSATEKSFTAVLTGILSAARTKRSNTEIFVVSDRVTTYQLSNSGSWFKSAIKIEDTRKWTNQVINEGDDIYVVVGYHTMIDAKIVVGAHLTSEISAWLKLPVTEALATAGVMMPLGDLGDPVIRAKDSQQQGVHRRFVAIGEQVCAVQYRKIRFSWLSSRNLDKAALEKENRWKVHWNVRGQEVGTNDVVEADLQDELEIEDEHEKQELETEQFLF